MWAKLASKYANQGDWFLKSEESTYVNIEALRAFLRFYNPAIPRYFGHTVLYRLAAQNLVFNSDVAYVLSREAVLQVAPVLNSLKPSDQYGICADRAGGESAVELSVCLRSVGINPENTLDHKGRQRFLVFHPSAHIKYTRDQATRDQWYWKWKPKQSQGGLNCCADAIISWSPFTDESEDIPVEQLRQYQNLSSLIVPPRPRLFLYDSDLPVPLSAHRNVPNPPQHQPVFEGYPSYW
jgi:hypothetical protein